MRWLQYDLPRQTLIAFVAAIAITAVIGWLISSLDQVTPEEIAKAEVRGDREGRIDGYEAGFERGRLDGAGRARLAIDDLLESGDAQAGYESAYDFAWNSVITTALNRAKREKLEVDSAFNEWEALLR